MGCDPKVRIVQISGAPTPADGVINSLSVAPNDGGDELVIGTTNGNEFRTTLPNAGGVDGVIDDMTLEFTSGDAGDIYELVTTTTLGGEIRTDVTALAGGAADGVITGLELVITPDDGGDVYELVSTTSLGATIRTDVTALLGSVGDNPTDIQRVDSVDITPEAGLPDTYRITVNVFNHAGDGTAITSTFTIASSAGASSAADVSIADGPGNFAGDNVELALAELAPLRDAVNIELADVADNFTATDVEGALAELFASAGSIGAADQTQTDLLRVYDGSNEPSSSLTFDGGITNAGTFRVEYNTIELVTRGGVFGLANGSGWGLTLSGPNIVQNASQFLSVDGDRGTLGQVITPGAFAGASASWVNLGAQYLDWSGVPEYVDNAAAVADGQTPDTLFKTPTGEVRVVV